MQWLAIISGASRALSFMSAAALCLRCLPTDGPMRNTDQYFDFPRVHLQEASDVVFWCNEFDCTEDQLRAAVMEVGVHPIDIGLALGKSMSPAKSKK